MFLRTCLVLAAAVLTAACTGAPATIEYVETLPAKPRINEITTVKFRLLDYRGVAQAGAMVTFRLQGASEGVDITPKVAMSLKGSGEVTTQIIANTGVNSVIVVADAGGKIATSPPISFAGSIPNGSQFTFQCGAIAGMASGGIHAIGAFDQERHLIAGVKLNCTAHTGDRNGDGVPNAVVSFLTEAGTIGPSEQTKTDVVGDATILYKTSLPFPKETTPGVFQWNPQNSCTASDPALCTGEYFVPLWMEPNAWTTNPIGTLTTGVPAYNAMNLQEPRRRDPIRRTMDGSQMPQNNPRDNLVTLIAVVAGEEGFIDKDQDGTFDKGEEEFFDQTEPFVDANDNATYDPDEKYVDTNGNGAWDGKNGEWDANTLLWRQERILWTGIPYGALYGGSAPGMGQLDDTTVPEPTVIASRPLFGQPIISCRVTPGGTRASVIFEFLVSDPWFNSLAQNGGADGCEKVVASKNVDVQGGLVGFQFTNPPVRRLTFAVVDNLNREPMPMTSPPSPGCYPPPPAANGSARQPWAAAIRCKFTSSLEEGHVVYLADQVFGEVDNNLPNVP